MDLTQLPAVRGISAYRFYSPSGGTLTGFFVDREGTNLGSFQSAIPSATVSDVVGGTDGKGIPAGATGCYLKATGTIYYAPGAGDIATNPTRYPTVSTTLAGMGVAA